ncbi:MAG: hypothetical protein ABJB86_08635 [Bacteroidota bacterium]
MEDQLLIEIINYEMDVELPAHMPFDELRRALQAIINKMIAFDFQKLVNILYRVDVNERKLKFLLQENVGSDAADIIADLIIERQLEKIRTRREFSSHDDNISDEEKW